jgi:pilus assembly protein CpaB
LAQRNVIIIAVAVLLGLFAVYIANAFFSGVETRQAQVAEQARMARIVVASQALAFGAPLSSQNVRLANWPANSVPEGAFTTLEAATKDRVALRPIVPGEPVLSSKVSGAKGRATLSANLPIGQLAYTIPISDVAGVGGFVRPGDVVDVLLTRKIPGNGSNDSDKMSDVVLAAVPVLGIDQVSDENKTEPAVGKTATVQVDTVGAQKLALSTQMGVMSLALRNVGDHAQAFNRTVTSREIGQSRPFIRARGDGATPVRTRYVAAVPRMIAPGMMPAMVARPMGPTMTIVRGITTTQEGMLHGN